ncbi:uncharacterized protein LOC127844246 isoform X3 [Dreissena polymorpha]|uniref:CUB domain-containing protein n=1 Tax=Dreissena polymorpha TaxID=45954 RepID=A0A9D4E021_DREPO|nr:uncharacterized protein LOC127844246 isoform X3 [Dreissena polymorpha]KAH3771222.1 hypothetical protein DPMN_172531 [Dreissena polymorpha]
MEALRVAALFASVVCLMRFERTDGISYKNMTDYCGSRITMYDDKQLLIYYIGSKECKVTIVTKSQFSNLMLYVRSFAADCIYGEVTIKNQYDESTYGLPESLCGHVSVSKVYTAYGGVSIKYTPKKLRWASFSFVVTLYSDLRNCPSNGHVCGNKRCIDVDLKCNGYNSCGDNSGCWFNSSKSDHSSIDGVGIGIGIAAGVIVLIVVSLLIICCRQRRTGTHAQQARPSAPPVQVVYSTRSNPGQFNDQSPPPYDPAWASNTHTNETQRPGCCKLRIECGF